MAEAVHINPEKEIRPPKVEALLPTAEQAEPLRRGEKDPAKRLKEARAVVKETARSDAADALEQLQAAEETSTTTVSTGKPLHINRELKSITLQRELTAIRRRLSLPERTLSKVVHNPVIRTVSEPASKSVSRPSGLLGGGLVAFLGSSAYLYLAKQNGMRYQYSIFLVLFAGGFIVGLCLEFLVHLATHSRRHAND